jgi:hypothetical protein
MRVPEVYGEIRYAWAGMRLRRLKVAGRLAVISPVAA